MGNLKPQTITGKLSTTLYKDFNETKNSRTGYKKTFIKIIEINSTKMVGKI